MDVGELEVQYDARATVDDIQPYLDRYRGLTDDAKARLDCHVDVSFGATPEELMDIFPAEPEAPAFVFIHGGYWRLLSKDDGGFMAPALARAGIATVAVNYALAPHVPLAEITRQCRAAVAHLWTHAERLSLDDASIAALSPIRHVPDAGCPMLVAWGEHETAEFARQSRDFAAAWAAKGGAVETLEVSGRNHFDVILDLADPDTTLARRTVALIRTGKL